MKKFLIITLSGTFAGVLVLLSITTLRIYKYRNDVSYVLPKEVHTIMIGPSTIQTAINDDLLDGTLNLGRSGTNYTSFTPVLEQILTHNPQVDTVFLAHGIFMAMSYSDESLRTEPLQYVHSHFPFMTIAPWKSYQDMYLRNPNFYGALLNPPVLELLWSYKQITDMGFGHDASMKTNLYNNEAEWSITWRNNCFVAEGSNKDFYSIDYIRKNYTYNLENIDNAIQLCKDRGVVPVLFFTPLYHVYRWVNDAGFREYMQQLDGNLLLADFQNFAFPNDDYYQDVYHLNTYGANFLTKFIANNGYQLQTLTDWLKCNNK